MFQKKYFQTGASYGKVWTGATFVMQYKVQSKAKGRKMVLDRKAKIKYLSIS